MLTSATNPGYASCAGAKSSAGRRNPFISRRNSAPISAGAFFVPAERHGGCAWASFGLAGFLECRFPTLRTVATQSRRKDRGDSSTLGVSPMTASIRLSSLITRSLKGRAAAHRAMAKSALFSDSSASVRLRKYNSHIEKAQQLEARALNAVSGKGGVA